MRTQLGPVVFWALRPEKISEFTFIEPIKWKSFILSHALAHSAHAACSVGGIVDGCSFVNSIFPNASFWHFSRMQEWRDNRDNYHCDVDSYLKSSANIWLFYFCYFFLPLVWVAVRAVCSPFQLQTWWLWWMKFSVSIADADTHTAHSPLWQSLHWTAHMVVLCQWLDQRLIISTMWSVSCCKAIHFISNLFDFICVECICVRRASMSVCGQGYWRRLPQTPYLLPYSYRMTPFTCK